MPNFHLVKPGSLYLVPTPIGNLEDISMRALNILKTVDLIAAEDTRHTGILLSHYEIKKKQWSFHQHNFKHRLPELISLIQEGKSVALVSDAGMPLISDPGQELVNECINNGVSVIPIPGPNAALTALIASGLPTDRFRFEGFLKPKKKERYTQLEQIALSNCTIILYESPHRIVQTIKELTLFLEPDRQIVIARV